MSIILRESTSPLIAPTAALHLDHPLHALEVDLARRPSTARPCVVLVVRLRTALRATSGVEVVVLGDDVAGFVRIRVHELDRLAARADHARG